MLSYYLYRLGQWVACALPLRFAYAVSICIADVRALFAAEDRRLVDENLRAIFPEKSLRQIRRVRRRMFRNFARYLVDFFRFGLIDKAFIERSVRIEGRRHFDEALLRKKGVVALTAHLGNWELGGVVTALSGYPLWAVALEHRHPKVSAFFWKQREEKGVRVMSLGKAARQCLRVLRDNQILALVGDRDFTGRGVTVPFFGRPALFPPGPAALSLSTGASIVPGFMLRNKDGTFTLHLEPPINFEATGDREKDIPALTEKCRDVIERYIRSYPDQWFMFRRFWLDETLRPDTGA